METADDKGVGRTENIEMRCTTCDSEKRASVRRSVGVRKA